MEHLHEVDAQLHMVTPTEDGAMDALAGIQVCRPLLLTCNWLLFRHKTRMPRAARLEEKWEYVRPGPTIPCRRS